MNEIKIDNLLKEMEKDLKDLQDKIKATRKEIFTDSLNLELEDLLDLHNSPYVEERNSI